MAEDSRTENTRAEDRKGQPRFSQFALAAARDTSAFEPRTAPPEEAAAAPRPEISAEVRTVSSDSDDAEPSKVDARATAAKRPRPAKAPSPPPEEEEELISFTVRLPASLYMRMRRSLGLRERLGELCIAAITRELDLRR